MNKINDILLIIEFLSRTMRNRLMGVCFRPKTKTNRIITFLFEEILTAK